MKTAKGIKMSNRIELGFVALLLLAGSAFAGIVGTPHDLKGKSAFGNSQELCVVCHVPHKSGSASFLIPSGKVYAGGNLTTYGGTVGQPTNSSSICLSCHDGILAPSVGTNSTDYTHSHPFSVVYPTKTGYATPVAGKISGSYGSLPLEGTAKDRIECGSCHNPHEKGSSGNFLRIENTGSNLCLTCHQK